MPCFTCQLLHVVLVQAVNGCLALQLHRAAQSRDWFTPSGLNHGAESLTQGQQRLQVFQPSPGANCNPAGPSAQKLSQNSAVNFAYPFNGRPAALSG